MILRCFLLDTYLDSRSEQRQRWQRGLVQFSVLACALGFALVHSRGEVLRYAFLSQR